MLDSQPRLPRRTPLPPDPPSRASSDAHDWADWEESSFTRPMRSPFETPGSGSRVAPRAPEPRRAPAAQSPQPLLAAPTSAEVDVSLEEAALFDAPRLTPTHSALRHTTTAPPPRRSLTPAPFEEETAKRDVSPSLLRAIRDLRDSSRLRAAARTARAEIDLAKTMEEPTLDVDEDALLSTSEIRPLRR